MNSFAFPIPFRELRLNLVAQLKTNYFGGYIAVRAAVRMRCAI